MLKVICKFWLWFRGWTVGQGPPDVDKYVLITAPHTSNWDFVYLICYASANNVELKWMGKHTLFNWPFRRFFTSLGGVPVNRDSSNNVVAQMAEQFKNREKFVLAIPAEGTRSYRDHWKSGFYHIARAANVPIVPSMLDYKRKHGAFGPAIEPTDIKQVMDQLREIYSGVSGKFPKKFSRIYLKEEGADAAKE